MKYAFTSDTHFGHSNIIKYCNRPFANAADMDLQLIANWNSVCDRDTVVYHLGDFGFGRPLHTEAIVSQLQFAHLHVIKGNHDKTFCEWYRQKHQRPSDTLFNSHPSTNVTLYNSYLETVIDGTDFTLCHYAMLTWNKSHHGSIHLYGHSHGNLPDNPNVLSMDVGVDTNNYRPYTLDEILRNMQRKTFKGIDHHK